MSEFFPWVQVRAATLPIRHLNQLGMPRAFKYVEQLLELQQKIQLERQALSSRIFDLIGQEKDKKMRSELLKLKRTLESATYLQLEGLLVRPGLLPVADAEKAMTLARVAAESVERHRQLTVEFQTEELEARIRLARTFEDPIALEGLYLSSQALYNAAVRFTADTLAGSQERQTSTERLDRQQRKLIRSLFAHIARACSKTTPRGLLTSIGYSRLDPAQEEFARPVSANSRFSPIVARRTHIVLTALRSMARELSTKYWRSVVPRVNSTWRLIGEEIVFQFEDPLHPVSLNRNIRHSQLAAHVLERVAERRLNAGDLIRELASEVAKDATEIPNAGSAIESLYSRLCEAGLIRGELEIPFEVEDGLSFLIKWLEAVPGAEGDPDLGTLREIQQEIYELDRSIDPEEWTTRVGHYERILTLFRDNWPLSFASLREPSASELFAVECLCDTGIVFGKPVQETLAKVANFCAAQSDASGLAPNPSSYKYWQGVGIDFNTVKVEEKRSVLEVFDKQGLGNPIKATVSGPEEGVPRKPVAFDGPLKLPRFTSAGYVAETLENLLVNGRCAGRQLEWSQVMTAQANFPRKGRPLKADPRSLDLSLSFRPIKAKGDESARIQLEEAKAEFIRAFSRFRELAGLENLKNALRDHVSRYAAARPGEWATALAMSDTKLDTALFQGVYTDKVIELSRARSLADADFIIPLNELYLRIRPGEVPKLIRKTKGGDQEIELIFDTVMASSNRNPMVELFRALSTRPNNDLFVWVKPLFRRLRHVPRLTNGIADLVRESWTFARGELPIELNESNEDWLEQFIAWNRFRMVNALPRHTFYRALDQRNPIYVDFSSPYSLAVLTDEVRKNAAAGHRFDEMRPSPADLEDEASIARGYATQFVAGLVQDRFDS